MSEPTEPTEPTEPNDSTNTQKYPFKACNNVSLEDDARCTGVSAEIGTAGDLCRQVEENMDKLREEGFIEKLGKNMTAFNPVGLTGLALSKAIEAIFPKSESVQTINTKISNTVSTMSTSEIQQECVNELSVIQECSFEGLENECMKSFENMLKLIPLKDRAEVINKYIENNKLKVSGVTCKFDATIVSQCLLKAFANLFTDVDIDTDTMTMMKAINEASGPGTKALSNQNVCKDISNKISACQYAKQTMCCLNHVTVEQSGRIRQGCTFNAEFTDINIEANAFVMATCDMTASTTLDSKTISAIKDRTIQKAENTAELDLFNLYLLLLLIPLLLTGGAVYAIKKGGAALKWIIGSILGISFLLAVTMFVCYFMIPQNPERVEDNWPRSTCKSVKSLADIDRARTFAEVKEKAEEKGVHSVDFFVQNYQGGELDDSTFGFGIYSYDDTEVDQEDDCIKYEGEGIVRTFYVKKLNINLLITGIISAVLCVALAGYLLAKFIWFRKNQIQNDPEEKGEHTNKQKKKGTGQKTV